MAFLNLDSDFVHHPKTTRLEQMLGILTGFYPIKLWCWCAKYSKETGIMTKMNSGAIEMVLGWNGDPGKAVDALVECGFLEKNGDEYAVHDWETIQGHLIAFSVRGKQANKIRWDRIRNQYGSSLKDPTGIQQGSLADPPSLAKLSIAKPITKAEAQAPASGVESRCSYENQGFKCQWQREPRALFCREHIEKLKDARRARSDGFRPITRDAANRI